MSTTEDRSDTSGMPGARRVDMNLEVLVIPVSDADRAKEFYSRLGWRLVSERMKEMYPPITLGETAENVAEKYGVTRQRQDEWALRSHRLAAAARDEGRFETQIVPVTTTRGEVTGDGLLRLSRSVEMYQWKETSSSQSQQSVGGSKTTETTYTYQRVWSAQPIVSTQFKVRDGHQNPPMQVQSATFDAGQVKLGAYGVDPPLLNKLATFAPLQVQSAPPASYQASGDGFYQGQNPGQPAIGDIRVTFGAIPAQTISVAAAQSNGMLAGYRDANGYTIALAEPGVVTAAALFHDEQTSESRLTWILRGAGFVAMLIGFVCMTRPLTMVFAVLPFLESLVGAGAFLVALTLAVPITLVTIAVAWIVHRPLIGVLLLVGAVAALYLLRKLHPRRQVPAPA